MPSPPLPPILGPFDPTPPDGGTIFPNTGVVPNLGTVAPSTGTSTTRSPIFATIDENQTDTIFDPLTYYTTPFPIPTKPPDFSTSFDPFAYSTSPWPIITKPPDFFSTPQDEIAESLTSTSDPIVNFISPSLPPAIRPPVFGLISEINHTDLSTDSLIVDVPKPSFPQLPDFDNSLSVGTYEPPLTFLNPVLAFHNLSEVTHDTDNKLEEPTISSGGVLYLPGSTDLNILNLTSSPSNDLNKDTITPIPFITQPSSLDKTDFSSGVTSEILTSPFARPSTMPITQSPTQHESFLQTLPSINEENDSGNTEGLFASLEDLLEQV